jgi:hypothetical protein
MNQQLTCNLRMDLSSTFECLVGVGSSQKSFTVYTHVLTKASEFMRAARSPQWLADPKKPVDLQDEDPEIFSAYLNIVYAGAGTINSDHLDLMPSDPQVLSFTELKKWHAFENLNPSSTQDTITNEASDRIYDANAEREPEAVLKDAFDMSLEECEKRASDMSSGTTTPHSTACDAHFTTLARIHILVDKLGDPATANLVIDEFVSCNSYEMMYNPSHEVVNLIYESTVHGSPLRRLVRDIWIHQSSEYSYLGFHAVQLHRDFTRDIMVDTFRTNFQSNEPVGCEYEGFAPQKTCADRCHYHIHGELCPRCVPKADASAKPCAAASQ